MKFSEIELPSNRKFGSFFTAIFAVVGLYFLWKDSTTFAYVFLGLSALFAVITLLMSDLLLPLNKMWMGLGFLLGMIISPIVLGLIFFLLFTPIALIAKLLGRDELRLKLSDRRSHWKPKSDDAAQAGAFQNQF